MSEEYVRNYPRRRFITLESKILILNRLREGERVHQVAKSLGINEATIRTILKNEDKIRTSVAVECPTYAEVLARPRALIIQKMERSLIRWIYECSSRNIPLDTVIIQHKALHIYNTLFQNGEYSALAPKAFGASKGWFDKLRRRAHLQNLQLPSDFFSYNAEIAEAYRLEMSQITNCDLQVPTNLFHTRKAWWVARHQDDLSNETNCIGNNVNTIDLENPEENSFHVEALREALVIAEHLIVHITQEDPILERREQFQRDIRKCMAPYEKIFKDILDERKEKKGRPDVNDLESVSMMACYDNERVPYAPEEETASVINSNIKSETDPVTATIR